MIENIFIPQLLKMPEGVYKLKLNDYIQDLKSLTPVKGIFQVTHCHSFLDVELKANVILTMVCDRCLQTFNHRLSVDTKEVILLQYPRDESHLPIEREIMTEDLSETLPPTGELEVEQWIYEQLSLAMPLRNICGNECQMPTKTKESEDNQIDDRWSALNQLKSSLSEQQNN